MTPDTQFGIKVPANFTVRDFLTPGVREISDQLDYIRRLIRNADKSLALPCNANNPKRQAVIEARRRCAQIEPDLCALLMESA